VVRRILVLVSLLTLLIPSTVLANDPDRAVAAPKAIRDARIDGTVSSSTAIAPSRLDRSLLGRTGPQAVVVRLKADSVAEVAARGRGPTIQKAQLARVEAQQARVVARATQLDATARVLGSTQRALNAVMLRINATQLGRLANSPDVERISPVVNYELDLSETVPYIGATAAHDAGFTGEGVRVAVLDSGVDYTHAALGGPGTRAAYDAAFGMNTQSGHNRQIDDRLRGRLLFPTESVVGGFDFVGEQWPFGPLRPDPDPIDCGFKDIKPQKIAVAAGLVQCSGGHGTHVADILGGNIGVAPDADLYAVKVCSSVSTSCSGVALIQGMDFAVDPNGDGSTADAVDIVNMSLGSVYGQVFFDDLSQAVENASSIGVLTVAASGNAADKPYVTDSPAAAPSAISVAQTEVPSAVQAVMQVLTPPSIAGDYLAVFQPWSVPLEETGAIEAPLQYGDGAGGNLNGCAPFAAGSLAGKIVLVDRGTCNFTLKVSNVGVAGGLAAIIGLIAPGDPFTGADGGDRPIDIPGFMISQADSNTLKSGLAAGVTIRFDPEQGIPLVGTVVGSSSRGPTMLDNRVKPEIGAPGASVSAIAGRFNATGPFGGTSGATPMVAGSAALVLDAFASRSPAEVKAVLMNTADTDIDNSLPDFGGRLAPVSRIGGGEVRVDAAIRSPVAAWDTELESGVLSFGFHDVTDAVTTLTREVTLKNYTGVARSYTISNEFRFAEDEASGAVSITAPASVNVGANGTATFDVTLTIDGEALGNWLLNSGSNGASGNALTGQEFDGYLRLTDASSEVHLGWQVLPRQAGDVQASADEMAADESIDLTNNGVGPARVIGYSLIGQSPDNPDEGSLGGQNPVIDIKNVGSQTLFIPGDPTPEEGDVGLCTEDPTADSFVLALAVSTWERQTHANAPAAFEFDIDTSGDGVADFAIFNQDLSGGALSDGRNIVFTQDLNDPEAPAQAFFFTLHATNAATTVLLVCAEQIGMTIDDAFAPITGDLLAVDIYFTGNVTDVVEGLEFAPFGERYIAVIGGQPVVGLIPPGATEALEVLDFGPDGTNPSETGVMLLYNANNFGGAYSGAPEGNDDFAVTITEE
jgi:minor extracellular serine protease Vpr